MQTTLEQSIDIDIHKMYNSKHSFSEQKSYEILRDLQQGVNSYIHKMQKIQDTFYRYQLMDTYYKESLDRDMKCYLTQQPDINLTTCDEFFETAFKFIRIASDVQRSMSWAINNAWEQWDNDVNLSQLALVNCKVNEEIKDNWSVVACAVDVFNLSSIVKIAQGNVSCSLVTEKTPCLYKNRGIALLYLCNSNSTLAMCDSDMYTGPGSSHRCNIFTGVLEKFYRDFYNTSFMSDGALPECCSGSDTFYDVLPLELVKASATKDASIYAANEIVIKGNTKPYSIVCLKEHLAHALKIQHRLSELGWDLGLFELTSEHSLIRRK